MPLPATSELIVSLGTAPFGLKDAFAESRIERGANLARQLDRAG